MASSDDKSLILAVLFFVIIGAAWLLMAPFLAVLREGGPPASEQ